MFAKLTFGGVLFLLSLSNLSFSFPNALMAPDCAGSLSFGAFSPVADFDVNYEVPMRVEVTRGGTAVGCDYFVSFDYGTGGATSWKPYRLLDGPLGGGSSLKLSYNLFKDDTWILPLRERLDVVGGNHVVYPGRFTSGAGGTSNVHTYYAKLDTEHHPGGLLKGTYEDIVRMQLVMLRGPRPWSLIQEERIRVRYSVPAECDLSLVQSSGAFDTFAKSHFLHFGEITTGETLNFDYLVKSNGDYNVTFSSLKAGYLGLLGVPGAPPPVNSRIPYTLTVSGATAVAPCTGSCQLTATTITSTGDETVTSGTPDRVGVTVTIGTVPANIGAGSYDDTVTVVVTVL